jgi:hypothetical protein
VASHHVTRDRAARERATALTTRHDAIDQWHAAHSRANRHGCLGRWVALAIDASGTLGPDHAICRSRKSSCKDDEPQRTDRTQQTKRPFHQVTSMSKASKNTRNQKDRAAWDTRCSNHAADPKALSRIRTCASWITPGVPPQ